MVESQPVKPAPLEEEEDLETQKSREAWEELVSKVELEAETPAQSEVPTETEILEALERPEYLSAKEVKRLRRQIKRDKYKREDRWATVELEGSEEAVKVDLTRVVSYVDKDADEHDHVAPPKNQRQAFLEALAEAEDEPTPTSIKGAALFATEDAKEPSPTDD